MSFWFPFGLSGHEIYRQVTEGEGTRSLDAGFEAAKLEAELEQARAIEIRRLAEDLGQGWQGQAADAAVSVVQPFADSAEDRAAKLKTAYVLLDAQSNMFNHTKNSVVPMPAEPPKGNVLNDLIPWETDLDRQIKQYQRDAQHNIDIYSRFDDDSLNSEQQVPRDFPSNTEWSGTMSVSEPVSAPGDGPKQSGPSSPQPGSSSWPAGGGPNPGGPNPVSTPDSAGAPHAVGFAEPPQGTDPSDAGPPGGAPPGTRPPIVGPPQPPGAVPPFGGWPPGTVPPDGRVPGSGPVGRAPGLGPDGGRGGSGSGAPGARGAAGGSEGAPGGRGAGSGGGPGARGGAFGEPGSGGRPGAGAGGMAGEGAAGQRGGGAGAAGGRGAGTAGGYGPMGGGRASGAEDHEHQRKYLIGPDPDDTFGTSELTAPPVIGEGKQE